MDEQTIKEAFIEAVHSARSGKFNDGVWYTQPNEQELSVVLGWEDGYEEEDGLIQRQEGDTLWTLCGKVAYNVDDLQCDYDIDWYMPSDSNGDIYDTSMAIHTAYEDYKWFYDELVRASQLIKEGKLHRYYNN